MPSISVKLAIYAHFSSSDKVLPFAWPYLDSLLKLGFEVIFVSNSAICNEDMRRLEAINATVLVRDNFGLDFGMWKAALERVDLASISELLLTNSSIIGPVLPLAPIFETARNWNCDFWGMTDNTEYSRHLQSYFIVLTERVLRSEAFKNFWKSVLPYQSKDQIVMSYEIGFTVWLQEQGYSWRPFVYQKDVWNAHIESQGLLRTMRDRWRAKGEGMGNVTLLLPDRLLELGMPFVKSSLLGYVGLSSKNPESARIIDRYKTENKC